MVRLAPALGGVIVRVALSRMIDGCTESAFRISALLVPGNSLFSTEAGRSSKAISLLKIKGPALSWAIADGSKEFMLRHKAHKSITLLLFLGVFTPS
jgi:hypothetical protein